MVEIRGKIMRFGNGNYVRIPKDLLDCKVLQREKEYTFKVVEVPKEERVAAEIQSRINVYSSLPQYTRGLEA